MPETAVVRTREQQRAEKAFQRIRAASNEPWAREYGRLCLRLPALIQQCGLCQALTFYEAKGAADVRGQSRNPEFHRLLEDLAEVSGLAPNRAVLLDEVRKADLVRYQWMTRELLRCAVWFKRYAEAYLKVQPGEEE